MNGVFFTTWETETERFAMAVVMGTNGRQYRSMSSCPLNYVTKAPGDLTLVRTIIEMKIQDGEVRPFTPEELDAFGNSGVLPI